MDIRSIGSVGQSGATAPPAPDPSANSNSVPASSGSSAGSTTPVVGVQQEPTFSQVNQAVQKINTAMTSQSQGIEFAVDSSSHRIVVKIIDQQTNQVIRQIPSKEALAIADSLDQTQGLLIKQQA